MPRGRTIDHQQFVAPASVGLAASVGAARLWVELGVGARALREVLSKHPVDQAPGVAGETQTVFTLGPYVFGEAGVALVLRGRARGLVAAGPTEVRTIIDGVGRRRPGAVGRIGVAYDF